ncbi:MAG: helix-turn-helix domain-containing protein [bacterium]|nr:helix-turn-helix domain-containing protein [bacterium]
MNVVQILKKLGFDEKEIRVYMILLSLGPSPVRKIAVTTDINRGTTYDILKNLMRQGMVSYFHKDKKQYFVVEDPVKLEQLVANRLGELTELKETMRDYLPELRSLYNRGDNKPVARYFEGSKGVRQILNDVLESLSKAEKKEYFVYSSSDIREHIYDEFPNFVKERIARGIFCKTIALGEGGKEHPLSERKWLTKDKGSPSYTIIFPPKTAYICWGPKQELLGVVINDAAIAKTQQLIFEKLWQTL